MTKRLWTFEGFTTAADNRVIHKWYWEELSEDDRDDIRDIVRYLGNVERNLWGEPRFKWLGDIGEIRKKTDHGALRIYGYFADRPHVFVMFYGHFKTSNKDRQGMKTARQRLKDLKRGAGTHEFNFEKKSD